MHQVFNEVDIMHTHIFLTELKKLVWKQPRQLFPMTSLWLTSLFLLQDVSSTECSGSGFVNIGGLLSMIEVATDGSVFGVNKQGNLFQRWLEPSS